jgi:hypothetical protein
MASEPKNIAAWVTMFGAWLTTRDEPVTIGATHDCGPVAELCDEFCDGHGLGPPQWHDIEEDDDGED